MSLSLAQSWVFLLLSHGSFSCSAMSLSLAQPWVFLLLSHECSQNEEKATKKRDEVNEGMTELKKALDEITEEQKGKNKEHRVIFRSVGSHSKCLLDTRYVCHTLTSVLMNSLVKLVVGDFLILHRTIGKTFMKIYFFYNEQCGF